MIRILLFIALVVLTLSHCGCGDKRQDQVPTQIQAPPHEQPTSGDFSIFPTQKK